MSAVPYVVTRDCLDCKRPFQRLLSAPPDALCPSCREKETARCMAIRTCVRCGTAITPSPFASGLCSSCANEDTIRAIEKWGSN